tara:strand:+ start:188 stop:847 length:660 start_codon:yes stop_codon:yes gene_type:complete
MIIKVAQINSVFLFAGLMIILPDTAGATRPAKLPSLESLSSPLSTEKNLAPPTVFGGVGRKLPTWQAGFDLLLLSTPHYSAFRNRLELRNHVYWGEWWYNDHWGIKGLFSEQSFRMFSATGNRSESKTSHLGALAKTQHSLTDSWKISAGLGVVKTELALGSQLKQGNSLVTEFRMGMEMSANFWTEVGILTIDSASGSGSEDQRLGSTGYLIGLSYGF